MDQRIPAHGIRLHRQAMEPLADDELMPGWRTPNRFPTPMTTAAAFD